MSATTLPMSRPAMKMLTAFTRCAFSREMLIAPLAMRNSARSDSVTAWPSPMPTGTVRSRCRSRSASSRRSVIGNLRSPSHSSPTWRPPSAVSITSSMSRTFSP
ncbi:hypothetical protein G6F57_019617 [Rhizopus arrhizus]|nr:hypothetical protein G6F57_019617 [Rhizopus arrhizus]